MEDRLALLPFRLEACSIDSILEDWINGINPRNHLCSAYLLVIVVEKSRYKTICNKTFTYSENSKSMERLARLIEAQHLKGTFL